jgi:hypothetical protein
VAVVVVLLPGLATKREVQCTPTDVGGAGAWLFFSRVVVVRATKTPFYFSPSPFHSSTSFATMPGNGITQTYVIASLRVAVLVLLFPLSVGCWGFQYQVAVAFSSSLGFLNLYNV